MDRCTLLKLIVERTGSVRVGVDGQSMMPSIASGESVTLTPKTKFNEGDIICFPGDRSNLPVLHRIIRIAGSRLYVAGDNGVRVSQIAPSAVIGIVSEIRPKNDSRWFRVSQSSYAKAIASFNSQVLNDPGMAYDSTFALKRERLCKEWRAHVLS